MIFQQFLRLSSGEGPAVGSEQDFRPAAFALGPPSRAQGAGSGQASTVERRRHLRVRLRLPVRLRWPTPLGQLTEVTETLNVCRDGLLVSRREPCRAGAALWVTFPFDPALPLAQPETPARVARVKETPAGSHLLGIVFETSLQAAAEAAPEANRRQHNRAPLALPIRVRPPGSPWPEEAMTVDISDDGLRFCTPRLYRVGDALHLALPPGAIRGPWGSAAEVLARVVRVVRSPSLIEQEVAVVLLRAPAS